MHQVRSIRSRLGLLALTSVVSLTAFACDSGTAPKEGVKIDLESKPKVPEGPANNIVTPAPK